MANFSIDVTSETAKDIVKYLQCLMQKNINLIKVSHTVNRLGWQGGEFVPYSDKVKCDSIAEFSGIYKSIASKGNYDLWREHCLKLRENIYLRLTMAAELCRPFDRNYRRFTFYRSPLGRNGSRQNSSFECGGECVGKTERRTCENA